MTRNGDTLLVFGLGYSGRAVALAAQAAGFSVIATSRSPGEHRFPAGVIGVDFAAAGPAIERATHLLATAPPGEAGDPVLARYAATIATAPRPRWIGYLSTNGVYGDHGGAWVDEDTTPAPGSARTRRRLAAEADWAAVRGACAVDLFRLAGIYGPGRSALDDLRAGTARRVVKPGHAFGRIHRDDIAQAVLAAMCQAPLPGPRVLNLADDTPEETARVVEEAARLLGVEPPAAVPFAEAWARMSPMARGFWAENRKVASRKTQAALGIAWRYPSYREGLRAILAEERGEGPAQ
jgi:nucleoside-diphosphate-sugar epimerase